MSKNFNREIVKNVVTNKEWKSILYVHQFGYYWEHYGRSQSKRKTPEKRIVQRSWKEHRTTQYKTNV